MNTLTTTSGAGGGAKAPLTNASNILHIETELNASHGTPPPMKSIELAWPRELVQRGDVGR